MTQLTNDEIDKAWEEAKAAGNTSVLALIEEIDYLKENISRLDKRRLANKATYRIAVERIRKKSFHQGQSYMRSKIMDALTKTGRPDAAELASRTHVDYNIDPVGKYENEGL